MFAHRFSTNPAAAQAIVGTDASCRISVDAPARQEIEAAAAESSGRAADRAYGGHEK